MLTDTSIVDKEPINLIEKALIANLYPFDRNDAPDIICPDEININEYIESVMIHPQAEKWIVDIVKLYAKRKKIKLCRPINIMEIRLVMANLENNRLL